MTMIEDRPAPPEAERVWPKCETQSPRYCGCDECAAIGRSEAPGPLHRPGWWADGRYYEAYRRTLIREPLPAREGYRQAGWLRGRWFVPLGVALPFDTAWDFTPVWIDA